MLARLLRGQLSELQTDVKKEKKKIEITIAFTIMLSNALKASAQHLYVSTPRPINPSISRHVQIQAARSQNSILWVTGALC